MNVQWLPDPVKTATLWNDHLLPALQDTWLSLSKGSVKKVNLVNIYTQVHNDSGSIDVTILYGKKIDPVPTPLVSEAHGLVYQWICPKQRLYGCLSGALGISTPS